MNRWRWPLAVVGLLALVWLAATLSSPAVDRTPFGSGTGDEPMSPAPAQSRPPPPEFGAGGADGALPEWLQVAAAVLCVVAALAVAGVCVVLMIRSWSGRQRKIPVEQVEPEQAAASADQVVAALDEGLAALLDTDTDPRRAVIACWVRLEEVAAAAGTPRQVGDTPTDLVRRLLDAHRVSRTVLDRFAAVYREARYATHAVDERMRRTAVEALRQLREELSGD